MRGFIGLVLDVSAITVILVLSVFPGQIVLWGSVGPILFHTLVPGVAAPRIFIWIMRHPSVESIFESAVFAFFVTGALVLTLEVVQIPIPNRVATNGDLLLGLGSAGLGLCITAFAFSEFRKLRFL